METVVQSPPDEAELRLLTDWGEEGGAQRRRRAGLAAVLVHIAGIGVLFSLPENFLAPPPNTAESFHIVTPLVQPRLERPTPLTQKAPNQSKVTAEFEVRAEAPRARLEMPKLPPGPKQTPRPAVIPQSPPPKPPAAIALPEAPKAEAPKPQIQSDLPQVAQSTIQPPPQIQAVEQPKLMLENAGGRKTTPSNVPRIPVPNSTVAGAIHETARGNGMGGQVVGDLGISDPGLFGGITTPPARGVQGASLELKSDPLGVDFRPYLQQVLMAVRRNWMAVIPESVSLGLRGRVALQFRIGKNGTVLRLVYAEQSGSRALDEAAVAGVSASNPFPPLPSEFKGDNIVVQLNFAYNMPRR
jgi:TonB family protein